MILIKKIKPGLWQPNDKETGAVMVITKNNARNQLGVVSEQMGLIRLNKNNKWQVVLEAAYEGREYGTFQSLLRVEEVFFDFYYIEIKP
jgi:hypothetical protein